MLVHGLNLEKPVFVKLYIKTAMSVFDNIHHQVNYMGYTLESLYGYATAGRNNNAIEMLKIVGSGELRDGFIYQSLAEQYYLAKNNSPARQNVLFAMDVASRNYHHDELQDLDLLYLYIAKTSRLLEDYLITVKCLDMAAKITDKFTVYKAVSDELVKI